MAPKASMSADEKRWRAESDADTLRRHTEITGDPARLRAAQSVLKKSLADTERSLASLKRTLPTAPKKRT